MVNVALEGLNSADIDREWPEIWKHLQNIPRCEEMTGGAQAVRWALKNRLATCWRPWVNDRPSGIVVTRIVLNEDGERTFWVWLVAGNRFHVWARYALRAFEAYATDQKCTFIAGSGRDKWRWVRREGYAPAGSDDFGFPIYGKQL